MSGALVLVVEDEGMIADTLESYLARAGYRTVAARDGEIALQLHRALRPDIVLLDLRLPKTDGHTVLAQIRAVSDTPVIIVSALGEDLEKLTALKCGADDYVVKPFNTLEVVARVDAVLRRTQGGGKAKDLIRIHDIEVDLQSYTVRRRLPDGGDRTLDLTLTEFRIVSHFARAPRRAYTRADIIDACFSTESDAMERTVDSHMSNIRKKFDAAGLPDYFTSVRGVGYKMIA